MIAVLTVAAPAYAQRSIDFVETAAPEGALIAAVSDVEDLSALEAVIGADATAGVERAIIAKGFKAKKGAKASFLTGAERFGEIHLIGLGEDEMRARDWEDFGGRAGGLAKKSKAETVYVLTPGADVDDLADAAMGAAIGQYSFDLYKSKAKPVTGALTFVSDEATAASTRYNGVERHLADAVIWTRNMQSEPANILYPEEFIRRARAQLRGVANVSVNVLDRRQMQRLGMGALLGVGQGSVRAPQMLIVEYNGGAQGTAPIVFAGKGVTFDTGGISIKPNSGMWLMKSDMTGAAAVTAAVMSLAKSGAPVNVVAVAPLVENMPSGSAQRPGDVVTTMSGKTVEIRSTDAEGRLILADAVWYAQEEFDPSLLVHVATLTGSVGRALGDEYAGLFTRDDAIAKRMKSAGKKSGEDLWRLPLHPNHDKQLKSPIADIKNSDAGAPGASIGAAFIGQFVKEETPWAGLDVAGVDWREGALPTVPTGASGFSVRLLDKLARETAE